VGYRKIKSFIPYPIVKDVLSQQYCLRSRGKWVSQIHEYDFEIKPSKIIKGQWLDKMLTKRNQEAIKMGEKEEINVFVRKIENKEWYSDIIYYLKKLTFPNHLVDHKRRSLRLKAMKYCLTEDSLRWRYLDGVILRCVNTEEANKLMADLH